MLRENFLEGGVHVSGHVLRVAAHVQVRPLLHVKGVVKRIGGSREGGGVKGVDEGVVWWEMRLTTLLVDR
jgi:hypothetical protein